MDAAEGVSPALLAALRAAAARRHRSCLAAVGVAAGEAAARSQLAHRARALYREAHGRASEVPRVGSTDVEGVESPSLLLCSRHNQASAEELGRKDSSWAFGQVQKHDCLGRTFDAAIVYDVDDMMPETLWAVAETVRGGGLLIVVLPSEVDLEVLASGAQENFHNFASRRAFFGRLLAALWERSGGCTFADANLHPLWSPLECHDFFAVNSTLHDSSEMSVIERFIASSPGATHLLCLACSLDQKRVLASILLAIIQPRPEDKQISGIPKIIVTGRRGRGKSTVVGLAMAGIAALHRKRAISMIVITAPARDNVGQVFESLRSGLCALGRDHVDISESSDGGTGGIYALPTREDPSVLPVQFARADQAAALLAALQGLGHSTLLVVDEAASIPIPDLRDLLAAPCAATLLASTLSGCEGTGGALAWKILAGTRAEAPPGKGYTCGAEMLHLTLEEPLRYGRGCPVERMLDNLLFLGAGSDGPLFPLDPEACGSAGEARLFEVDTLQLSREAHAEVAQSLVALLQTHYRTSASDVANMLSQPYMRAFALLPRGGELGLPPVVALLGIVEQPEGTSKKGAKDSRGSAGTSSERISRSHLTAFAIEQDFPELLLSASPGLRIARIVCDPRLRSHGFGSAAMHQLIEGLEACGDRVAMPGDPGKEACEALFREFPSHSSSKASWLGASFGLTEPLLRFWSRLSFVPAVLSPEPNPQTGELSLVMLRVLSSASSAAKQLLPSLGPSFGIRFLRRLRAARAAAPPTLLSIEVLRAAFAARCGSCSGGGGAAVGVAEVEKQRPWVPEGTDLRRLERLAGSQDPMQHLAHACDLLPVLAEAYFTGSLAPLRLRRQDEELLLACGARGLDAAAAAKDVGLASANLAALGVKRVAGEAAKRAGLCLGKEFLVVLWETAASSDVAALRAWLPPAYLWQHCCNGSRLGRDILELSESPGCSKHSRGSRALRLGFAAEWKYPLEAEVGELTFKAHGLEHEASFETDELGPGAWRIELRCYHQWHRQELQLEAETDVAQVPVSLVSVPPDPKDVEVLLLLWDPMVSSLQLEQCWACASLPPLEAIEEDQGESGVPILLPLRPLLPARRLRAPAATGLPPGCSVEVVASWTYPWGGAESPINGAQATAPPRRGKGLLRLSRFRLLGLSAPPPEGLRAEVRVLHLVDAGAAALAEGSSPELRLKVRLKQNRPEKGRSAVSGGGRP